MDVTSILSKDNQNPAGMSDTKRQNEQYTTRQGSMIHDQDGFAKPYSPSMPQSARGNHGVATATAATTAYPRGSPAKKNQKHVVFQLIDPEDPRIQARLPMRVMISTHDTTESIITTVKNFYGLYEYGVSFENKDGIGIIAAYDNFENDMVVYVRTVAQPHRARSEHARESVSPKKASLGPPFDMRPPQHGSAHSTAQLARSVGARSTSPPSEYAQRSASAAPAGRPRPSRVNSTDHGLQGDGDGYSSEAEGSVTSSRRSRSEQVNAEISVENIVEGGRRKRAFESSELPLFVPPQVPMSASQSSISPQRKTGFNNVPSPYASNQQTFSYTQPLPSPQSHGHGAMSTHGYSNVHPPQANRQLRGRASTVTYPPSRPNGSGVLPTPDPTVGSAISDEDVALQLMRLGDPLAFSHGRTSTSTLDDALSGKAEAASSDEDEEEDDEDEDNEDGERGQAQAHGYPRAGPGPQRKKQRLMNELPSDGTEVNEYNDIRDGTFADSKMQLDHPRPAKSHKSSNKMRPLPSSLKMSKPRSGSMVKSKTKAHHTHQPSSTTNSGGSNMMKIPMSPSSMPAPSRKSSIANSTNNSLSYQAPPIPGFGTAASTTAGTDEEDLSSKPRCQRCRKSKKGCDRQRPCGRCKDAGIGADGCVSEDEGNGKKGRYGRHMGVPVKKGEEGFWSGGEGPMVGDGGGGNMMGMGAPSPGNGYFLAPAPMDKSKKRKK